MKFISLYLKGTSIQLKVPVINECSNEFKHTSSNYSNNSARERNLTAILQNAPMYKIGQTDIQTKTGLIKLPQPLTATPVNSSSKLPKNGDDVYLVAQEYYDKQIISWYKEDCGLQDIPCKDDQNISIILALKVGKTLEKATYSGERITPHLNTDDIGITNLIDTDKEISLSEV